MAAIQHRGDERLEKLVGDLLTFVEPESEHSAASFCEGFAAAGGRVTNFTSAKAWC